MFSGLESLENTLPKEAMSNGTFRLQASDSLRNSINLNDRRASLTWNLRRGPENRGWEKPGPKAFGLAYGRIRR